MADDDALNNVIRNAFNPLVLNGRRAEHQVARVARALLANPDVVLRALGGEKCVVVTEKPQNVWRFPVKEG